MNISYWYKRRCAVMATIKTAISLDESIFKKVENLAKEMNISRSQLISRALENMYKEIENLKLLDMINESVAEYDADEKKYKDEMMKYLIKKSNTGE
jgi:predicted transcriptional regulator